MAITIPNPMEKLTLKGWWRKEVWFERWMRWRDERFSKPVPPAGSDGKGEGEEGEAKG